MQSIYKINQVCRSLSLLQMQINILNGSTLCLLHVPYTSVPDNACRASEGLEESRFMSLELTYFWVKSRSTPNSQIWTLPVSMTNSTRHAKINLPCEKRGGGRSCGPSTADASSRAEDGSLVGGRVAVGEGGVSRCWSSRWSQRRAERQVVGVL